MYQPTEVIFTDPRDQDGNPYEVAAFAIAQAEGILTIYRQALDAAYLMARNAHMERNLAQRKPPAGDGYATTAEGRKFIGLENAAADSKTALDVLRTAASFDPKHPPRVNG